MLFCMYYVFQSADSGESADCNKAIIIVTDELSENYEQVFRQYNWPYKLVCNDWHGCDSQHINSLLKQNVETMAYQNFNSLWSTLITHLNQLFR